MAEKIDVPPSARPETCDVAGIVADDEIGHFFDHRLQHACTPGVERKNQIFTDDTRIAVNENQDAAERMQLTECAADRLIELYPYTTGFDASNLHEGAR
jgi:hypothetical protein